MGKRGDQVWRNHLEKSKTDKGEEQRDSLCRKKRGPREKSSRKPF